VLRSGKKTRGEKMKVSLAMLLKTHGEKMSENGSLAMLMKKNELKSLSGDVDEKKDGYLAQLGWWVVAQFDAVAASGVARRYLAPSRIPPRAFPLAWQ